MPKYDYDEEAYLEGKEDARERPRVRRRAPEQPDPRGALTDARGTFRPTYRASKHEAGWLLASLATFYDQGYITDIEALVKGGKEATVYRCRADPSVGTRWLAAKVYRPRQFRAMRNDARYRRGRPLLNAMGGRMKETDRRMARAVDRRTATAVQAEHTSWLMYEYTTLQLLHGAGGAVPTPIAVGENAILMAYLGDEAGAAPTLSEIRPDPAHAARLFDVVLENVEILLAEGLVHGDLSPYNILSWEGGAYLIDFPQVVDVEGNPEARAILARDIARVCDYFSRHGVARDARTIAAALWERYWPLPAQDVFADLSRVSSPE